MVNRVLREEFIQSILTDDPVPVIVMYLWLSMDNLTLLGCEEQEGKREIDLRYQELLLIQRSYRKAWARYFGEPQHMIVNIHADLAFS